MLRFAPFHEPRSESLIGFAPAGCAAAGGAARHRTARPAKTRRMAIPPARSYIAVGSALVFPVAPLALRDPLDRRLHPSRASLVGLRLRDPLDVFAPVTGRKSVERR